MSGNVEHIVFDFASEDTLRDRSSIQRCLNTVVEQSGFKLCQFPESSGTVERPEGVTRLLRGAKIQSGGWIIDCEDLKGFRVSLGIPNHLQQLMVAVDNGYISGTEAVHYDRVRSLVRVCELVYESLHPSYGRGLVSPSVHPFAFADPSQQSSAVQAVHDYNFFGPDLVQQLGRKKLLSAPTWRTAEFDDGGILLVMSPNPIADWEPYTPNYRRTARVLGVEELYQGG